ncbi:MAG TPA: hypothetical protein VGL13_08095 [Polyangiaceae bacterium]|jgi:hypothetical protein
MMTPGEAEKAIEEGSELAVDVQALLNGDPPTRTILGAATRALEKLQEGGTAILNGLQSGDPDFDHLKSIEEAARPVMDALSSVIDLERDGTFRDRLMDLPEVAAALQKLVSRG